MVIGSLRITTMAIATATGSSLNKRFNEQNNGCVHALQILVSFFASSAKQRVNNGGLTFKFLFLI